MLAPEGEYASLFDSDNARYGGYGNIAEGVNHFTEYDGLYADAHLGWLKLYLPARSAQVLRLKPPKRKAAPKTKPAASKKKKSVKD